MVFFNVEDLEQYPQLKQKLNAVGISDDYMKEIGESNNLFVIENGTAKYADISEETIIYSENEKVSVLVKKEEQQRELQFVDENSIYNVSERGLHFLVYDNQLDVIADRAYLSTNIVDGEEILQLQHR